MRMNVGIYIYEHAEVLDFAGPFEVFSTASRLSDPPVPFDVFLIGEHRDVTARGGFQVQTDYTIEECPATELFIVVGGDHTEEAQKPQVLEWIASQSASSQITASVCTGVFLLAASGVVKSETVTTHWEDRDQLAADYPALQVAKNRRWVDGGCVVTSGGISAGIDMSLHLVRRLTDAQLAEETAIQMEYDGRR